MADSLKIIITIFIIVIISSVTASDCLPISIIRHLVIFSFSIYFLTYFIINKNYQEQFLHKSNVVQLAWYRIISCLSLFIIVLSTDITQTIYLPIESFKNHWPFSLVISPYNLINVRSVTFLYSLHYVTLVSIIFSILGIFTLFSIRICSILCTIHYYIDISYTHFHHIGLLPLQILYVLSIFGESKFLSLDQIISSKSNFTSNIYKAGYCQFTCITVYAYSYFMAGASKLLVSHGYWGNGNNIKSIILGDSMSIPDIIPALHFVPNYVNAGGNDAIFWIIGSGAIIIELSAILLLANQAARKIMPLLLCSLHLGILIMQKLTFYDLIILPAMFLPISNIYNTQKIISCVDDSRIFKYKIAPYVITILNIICLLFRWDVFPIASSFNMYAIFNKSSEVHYTQINIVTLSDKKISTDLTDYISYLNLSRWQDATKYPHRLTSTGLYGQKQINNNYVVFKNYSKLYNSDRKLNDKIKFIEQTHLVWDTKNDPKNENTKKLGQIIYFMDSPNSLD